MGLNRISIIIPIWNRAREIPRLVGMLERQTCRDFEVVFVDDGSTDETAELLSTLESGLEMSWISIAHSGPSAARNRGAELSKGAHLIFIDSDDSVAENYVVQFAAEIAKSHPQIVHCGVTTEYADGKHGKIELPEKSVLTAPICRPFLSGAFSVERTLFSSVGGFTEELRYAENRELALKLSRSPLLVPERVVCIPRSLYTYSCRGASQRAYRNERAHAARYIVRHHGETLARGGQKLTYHRLAVTASTQAGDLRRALQSAKLMIGEFPADPKAYLALAKCFYHFLRVLKVTEKVRTIGWFLMRPALYPELGRLAIRKIVRDKNQGGTPEEAKAWCEERALTAGEAVRKVAGQPIGPPLRERFPAEFEAADVKAKECPDRMGGAADLELLFYLCEAVQAEEVIETGVAYGWSSMAILLSLQDREGARLQSTDMPYPKKRSEAYVGCVVPEELRPSWRLIRLPDREGIPQALGKVATHVDLVHYDSDKSYSGRMWAYHLLWKALRPGGVFLSDDIRDNTAFRDFSVELDLKPLVVRCEDKFVGILTKPE